MNYVYLSMCSLLLIMTNMLSSLLYNRMQRTVACLHLRLRIIGFPSSNFAIMDSASCHGGHVYLKAIHLCNVVNTSKLVNSEYCIFLFIFLYFFFTTC